MEKFEIVSTVSTKEWKPNGLFKKLKDGLVKKLGGAKEAIQEAYAVVTGTINEQLESKNAFGLHHEVTDDGKIILNKFALAKAVADLSNNKTLTEEQKTAAKAHLLRHYQELEEEPPKSLSGEQALTLTGEMSGEVAIDQVPLSQSARETAEKLTEGDENPCWVAMEIEEGKGGHGNYKASALESIVRQVNSDEPMGYAGHQKPENVPYEFPEPTTHWLAAEMEHRDGKAIAKVYGLIDQKYQDLRRWVRAKRIKQVSIFGSPVYKKGTKDIVDYKLFSIDWTPRNRAGMTTRLLWASEMDDPLSGELDGSAEELRMALHEALKIKFAGYHVDLERVYGDRVIALVEKGHSRKLLSVPYSQLGDDISLGEPTEVEVKYHREYVPSGEMDGSYEELQDAVRAEAIKVLGKGGVWVRRLYLDYAIVNYDPIDSGGEKLYRFDYQVKDDNVVLSNQIEVTEKRIYEPVGEMKNRKGQENMTLQEMLAAIRSAMAKGETDLTKILGEIGLTPEQAVEQLGGDEIKQYKTGAEFGAKLAKALGAGEDAKADEVLALAGEMASVWNALGFDENKPEKPAEVVGEMANAQAQAAKQAHEQLVADTIKEKVSGEQAQTLVSRMIVVPEDATKEQITGEIDNLLKDEAIKGILGNMFIDKSVAKGASGSENEPKHLTTKTASI